VGKRSGVIEDEDKLTKLSPQEIDEEISRCEMRLRLAPTSRLKKAFQSRIHWLKRFRRKNNDQ
jgi:hypothetical protein